jgi:glycosyltransferase involved in cell wall biosynthesis
MRVFLLINLPVGAYLHYCAELGNALANQRAVDGVVVLAVFAVRGVETVGGDESRLLDSGVKLRVLVTGRGSRLRRLWRGVRNLWAHLLELRREGPAVLHVHAPTGRSAVDFLILVLHRALGVRVVRTVHEITAAERESRPDSWAKWSARWQLALANHLIAHDGSTKRRLVDDFGVDSNRISIIPHGNYLRFREFRTEPHHWPVLRAGELTILFLGIKRNKGIEVFLDALARLEKEVPGVRGLVAGQVSPGDEDLLDRIRGLGNVDLESGYVPNGELWKLFDRVQVVALPYLRGTTSGAVHLAFAFQRPVVVSDLDCFRELVAPGSNGMVVPQNDARALAETLAELATSPERLRMMGEAAFARECSAPYRWESIAEQTLSCYEGSTISE